MFFNLDKNSKQNLLNEYKQEALNYHQKKKDERKRRIQEEREYIAQREQLEKEADEKLFKEKMERKNAQMEEYQTMLLKTKNNLPGYHHNFNKNNDIVLNNWGGQEISHKIQNIPNVQNQQPQISNSNLENNIIAQGQAEPDTPWRGRRGRGSMRNEDHLSNLLNDNRNDQEINNLYKAQKQNKERMYKDLLYSQFQEANNKNLNLYGTNDPLILERKRKKYLIENPYAKKNNYEFGKSNLTHNPITDPQNNLDYNKYLRFSESYKNINNYQRNNNDLAFQQNDNNTTNMAAIGNQNYNNNNNRLEEFKSNNYDGYNMNNNRGIPNNNINFTTTQQNQNDFNNNLNNPNCPQIGQNLNNGYMNNSFRPTPSGQRIRQAAASNFF